MSHGTYELVVELIGQTRHGIKIKDNTKQETHTPSNMVSPGTEANMFGQLNAQLSNMYGHTSTPGLPQQNWQMPVRE